MAQYPRTSEYDADGIFEPLEPGDYLIRLIRVESEDKYGVLLNDRNGDVFHWFYFDVASEAGKEIRTSVYLEKDEPEATNVQKMRLGQFKQMQIALGMDINSPGNTDNMIGKFCKAEIVNNKSKDGSKIYTNIAKYMATDELWPADQKMSDVDDGLPF